MQADMLVYFIINLGNSSLTKKKKKKNAHHKVHLLVSKAFSYIS